LSTRLCTRGAAAALDAQAQVALCCICRADDGSPIRKALLGSMRLSVGG
jgi:hypothetical protein